MAVLEPEGVSAPVLVSMEDDEVWARRLLREEQQGGMGGRVSHGSLLDFCYTTRERSLSRVDPDSDSDSFNSACSDLRCDERCWEKKGDDDDDDDDDDDIVVRR